MLAQPKYSEIAILLIVSIMSFVANLPNSVTGSYVDKRLLLIALTVAVLIAMVRHLRALLSLSIIILAIGANLPDALAESVGVSPTVMTISLAAVVMVILLNQAFELLPSGIENDQEKAAEKIQQPIARVDTSETRLAVLDVISKGDLFILKRLLNMNVEINFSMDGEVPILIAAEKGYSDITQALIQHGANFRVRSREGKTPFEIALARKDNSTADILYNAIKQELSISERKEIVEQYFTHHKNLKAN